MAKKQSGMSAAGATAAMRDAADAASVLAFRLPMLWMGAFNPTAARQREAQRMVTEKSLAAAQGAAAAGFEMWRAGMNAWLGAASPANTLAAMNRAAWAPARRTLRVNARRLKTRTTL